MTTSYVAAMRDLFLDLSSVYPAMARAGVSYWSEMAANSTTYCAGVAESLVAAWRDPRHQDQIATDVVARFRSYLERSGDGLERALLELNQALVELGERGSRAGAPAGASRVRSTETRPWDPDSARPHPTGDETRLEGATPADLHALRDRLERLLTEVRRREAELESPPPRSAP